MRSFLQVNSVRTVVETWVTTGLFCGPVRAEIRRLGGDKKRARRGGGRPRRSPVMLPPRDSGGGRPESLLRVQRTVYQHYRKQQIPTQVSCWQLLISSVLRSYRKKAPIYCIIASGRCGLRESCVFKGRISNRRPAALLLIRGQFCVIVRRPGPPGRTCRITLAAGSGGKGD